jgi:hypothetical protein
MALWTAPVWISLYTRKIKFSFLSVCSRRESNRRLRWHKVRRAHIFNTNPSHPFDVGWRSRGVGESTHRRGRHLWGNSPTKCLGRERKAPIGIHLFISLDEDELQIHSSLSCATYFFCVPEAYRLFLAQMALASLVTISGPKKVSLFRAHPFQWPSKWIFPHQNHYRPAPYKQQHGQGTYSLWNLHSIKQKRH